MDTLTATAPHYVRCLKPNVLKLPAVFDSDLVLNQLRYAGMMETIKIRFLLPSLPLLHECCLLTQASRYQSSRKAGFPVRLTFDVFWRNYKCLAPQTRDLVLERENLEVMTPTYSDQRTSFLIHVAGFSLTISSLFFAGALTISDGQIRTQDIARGPQGTGTHQPRRFPGGQNEALYERQAGATLH
jgi:hypothetical protein